MTVAKLFICELCFFFSLSTYLVCPYHLFFLFFLPTELTHTYHRYLSLSLIIIFSLCYETTRQRPDHHHLIFFFCYQIANHHLKSTHIFCNFTGQILLRRVTKYFFLLPPLSLIKRKYLLCVFSVLGYKLNKFKNSFPFFR